MTSHMMSKGANVSLEQIIGDRRDVVVVIETISDGEIVAADASVLLVDEDRRVRSNEDLVFYNQPTGANGAVRLLRLVEADEEGDGRIQRDAIEVDLHQLPTTVQRIVVAASTDVDSALTFGRAASVRMWLATADQPLKPAASFEITELAEESALIFGEIYRRGDEWKLRAIGQGYQAGLAALVTDFGVDVDDSVESANADEQSDESQPLVDGDSQLGLPSDRDVDTPTETAQEAQDEPSRKLAISRRRRPARIASDWQQRHSPYLPVADELPWQRARLFPSVGIKSTTEQEMRSTGVLLSVVEIVREFGRAFVGLIGGPGGRVETFTEVRFTHGGEELRPDGLIRISRGSKVWHALVEVKTGKSPLDPGQVESYLNLAKAKGFDAVVTISAQLMAAAGESPISLDARKFRSVALKHLSWEEIITDAALVHGHTGIDDRTRARVMDEFIRYACDPQSGMTAFGDMGKHWVKVREAVKVRTIGPNDVATQEVCARFDQLARHIALQLGALTGQRVASVVPADHPDAVSRAKQLADSGELFGALRIPGATGLVILNANLGTERIACALTTTAPRTGRPATKVNWLTRQLANAPDSMRITAHHLGSRTDSTSALLSAVRDDPAEVVPPNGKDIRGFTVTLETSMGSKRAGSEGGFVSAMEKLVNAFYADVVQVIRDGRE